MSEDAYPLVSILILAYNRPLLFEKALNSALKQTYKNIEIVICDDSTNTDTKLVAERYCSKYKNIKYCYNGGPLGNYGFDNAQKCFRLCSGEYVNYLDDDDLLHPAKIEKMMKYFLGNKNIALVTSHRQRIDEEGNYLEDIGATLPITKVDAVFDGKEIAHNMIIKALNFIGEGAAVLFKKEYAEGFGIFLGEPYYYLADMGTWLSLLSKGNMVYLTETLSYYRVHPGQNTEKQIFAINRTIDNFQLIDHGFRAGFISEDEYHCALKRWANICSYVISIAEDKPEYADFISKIKKLNII